MHCFNPVYCHSAEIRRVQQSWVSPTHLKLSLLCPPVSECSELWLYLSSPWRTPRGKATKHEWNKQGREQADACFPPSQPLKRETCLCWAPLRRQAGAGGHADPSGLLPTPENSSSGRGLPPVMPCGHFVLWKGLWLASCSCRDEVPCQPQPGSPKSWKGREPCRHA